MYKFFFITIYFVSKKNSVWDDCFISFIFNLFILFFIGSSRLKNINIVSSLGERGQIKTISSNIEINRFYNYINEEDIINQLIVLSNPEKDLPTLFIWPEGVITSTYLKDISKYKNLFKKFGDQHFILFGINDLVLEEKNKVYNALVLVDNKLNIKSVYHKNKLVPFGEFLPLENLLSKIGLRIITQNYQSFSKGTQRDIIKIKYDDFKLSILPLICYEIIYSGKLSKINNFNLIINISEDGWFGKSIGPSQHFTHSIFRAIEEGKSVIRSSNNGISAIIGPKGKVIKIHESTEGGVLITKKLEKLNKLTIFSSYGRNNIFFYLVAIYISLIFFLKRTGR